MIRLIPLAVVAAALAACSTPPQTGGPAAAPRVVTIEHSYMPGSGVIQSVVPAPVATTASAGSSPREPLHRLEVKMDNGRVQYVDTPSSDFTKGMRVTLTPDRYIKRS
jgi:hypothetical protein